MQGIKTESTKTGNVDVIYSIKENVRYQAGAGYYIISQALLYYQAASLLHYRVIVLLYQAIITSSDDCITLSGNHYIIG